MRNLRESEKALMSPTEASADPKTVSDIGWWSKCAMVMCSYLCIGGTNSMLGRHFLRESVELTLNDYKPIT